MENKTPDVDIIETNESSFGEFICCVCLDLLYKPVVLACGHISCFWCVFQTMDPYKESHCPICRHAYNHFPGVCQLLHFLLLKLYPLAHKRRESQVTEEEKEYGEALPQFAENLYVSHCAEESQPLNTSSHYETSFLSESCSQSSFPPKEDPPMDKLESNERNHCCDSSLPLVSPGTSADGVNNVLQDTSLVDNNHGNGACKNISCADFLCIACKNLLCRPAVLNCGHVYCESCINSLQDEILRCEVCQIIQPNGLPKVCLILEHFLEEHFPEVYAQRRDALLQQAANQNENQSTCPTKNHQFAAQSSSTPTNDYLLWWTGQHGPKVHIGVGCDYCGMSPIIGERYKCKDCVEKIGFDLCEKCYNSPSKLPGRFNQRHRPEHKFEIVQATVVGDVLLSLEPEESEDDDSYDVPQDQEDASQPAIL